MKSKLPFQADKFAFKDLGGEHIARYVGDCVVCGSRVFAVGNDADPDPRGVIGPRHSAARLVAYDYRLCGPDVPMCYRCHQERDRYEKAMVIARQQWKALPA